MPDLPPKYRTPGSRRRTDAERKAAADAARAGSPVRRWLRSRRWKLRRRDHLHQNPDCVDCGAHVGMAGHADHDPPHMGDEHAFFGGPLRTRCGPCHNRKTAKFDGGFGNPRRGKAEDVY